MTWATLFTVAPFKRNVPVAPTVVLLSPISIAAARTEVISTAPTSSILCPVACVPAFVVLLKFMPTPPAPVGFVPNWATSVAVGTAPPVQLVAVNQAEPAAEDHKTFAGKTLRQTKTGASEGRTIK